MNSEDVIRRRIANLARKLAVKHRAKLDELKAANRHLGRPDFVWHYLLESFATMGRRTGWCGLIGNKANYNRLRFSALAVLPPNRRRAQVEETCRAAKIRMPGIKAGYILKCFEQVAKLGGPRAAKAKLLAQEGRAAKIAFLKSFAGIGDKYARNIMMDVYHPEFRDSIAVDARIKRISKTLGLSFNSYADQEEFYLRAAHEAGLNGWEMDRLMFHFWEQFHELQRPPDRI